MALPPQLSHVHDVFHVSLLRGYHYHPLHVASYPFDQIQPDMSLSEEPESILDRQERVMRNKVIPFVKILWKNHPEREATWETEESMRARLALTEKELEMLFQPMFDEYVEQSRVNEPEYLCYCSYRQVVPLTAGFKPCKMKFRILIGLEVWELYCPIYVMVIALKWDLQSEADDMEPLTGFWYPGKATHHVITADADADHAGFVKIDQMKLRRENTMAEQNVPAQAPARTDEQIISVDILRNTNFFRAFSASASVPAVYIQQFWNSMKYDEKTGVYCYQVDEQWFNISVDLFRKAVDITPVDPTHPFELPPHGDTVIDFVNQLGYPEPVEFVSNIRVNYVYQPWRAILTLINQCLTGKTSG
ncbi:integrase, catalytic region, zinc finger, CCHC-type containing protein, partial [Tanacetum coccineum]